MGDHVTTLRQQILQPVQRQMRDLLDLGEDEGAMRLKDACPIAANLAGAGLPVSRTRFDHLTTVEGAISKRSAMER